MKSSDSISQALDLAAAVIRNPIAIASYAELTAPVRENLDQLDRQIRELIPTETNTADSVIEHVFASGGKRIRPALYFFCTQYFGYQGRHLYPIAAVCEYVHTASLLHDDVVDSSTLRRNKPTANSIWGDQSSVLVGDLIYSRASELMAATGNLDVVSTFARAIRAMSEGELLQLEHVLDAKITREIYFRIIECKTATLISACCRAAALLADAPPDQIEAISNFGRQVGTAFQLVDDALDYTGKREVFGKKPYTDLLEGKVTLPLILLREQASDNDAQALNEMLSNSRLGETEVKQIAQLVSQYGCAEQSLEEARKLSTQAQQSLELLPASVERDRLASLAQQLVWRSV